MKVFFVSVVVAAVIAVAANLALTLGVQETAQTAFSAASARP